MEVHSHPAQRLQGLEKHENNVAASKDKNRKIQFDQTHSLKNIMSVLVSAAITTTGSEPVGDESWTQLCSMTRMFQYFDDGNVKSGMKET